MQKSTNYIDYVEGKSPLLIIVQHGGYLRCNLPIRKWGVLKRDRYTQRIGQTMVNIMRQNHNIDPSFLLVNLHRSHLDTNRKRRIVERYGLEGTLQVYNQLYTQVNLFLERWRLDHITPLVLDLHGFYDRGDPRDKCIHMGTIHRTTFPQWNGKQHPLIDPSFYGTTYERFPGGNMMQFLATKKCFAIQIELPNILRNKDEMEWEEPFTNWLVLLYKSTVSKLNLLEDESIRLDIKKKELLPPSPTNKNTYDPNLIIAKVCAFLLISITVYLLSGLLK